MRVLTIDIECSPSVAHVWGLFNQNIGLTQLQKSGEVISFAAKWRDKKQVLFFSTYHDGKGRMLEAAHALLSEADIVVSFNGKKFDMPMLNREFLLAGFAPPPPYGQVDLLLAARKHFRFTSNKLDHLVQELGLGSKLHHEGHSLWVKCLDGDPRAWSKMKKYNRQDVIITESLYEKLLPWISDHPHAGILDGVPAGCTNCGSANVIRQGHAYTQLGKYQRYQCNDCGKWLRSTRRVSGGELCAAR